MSNYDWELENPNDRWLGPDPEDIPTPWEEIITELDKLENAQGKMDENARLQRIDSLYLSLETF